MKKYFTKTYLLSFLFYFTFASIGMSIIDGWRSGVFSAFFSALIFVLFMPWFEKIGMKTAKKHMLKVTIEGEENATLCGGANHFKHAEAVGGKMVLFHDSLLFKSHRFNIQPHELHIPLKDIVAIAPYNVWGIAPTGLKITTESGHTEKFVVGSRQEWVDAITMAKAISI